MTDDALKPQGWPALLEKIRARTPARVLVERAGASYRTATQLELREAHAAARDAVRAEFDLERDLGAEFVREWKLFLVSTLATGKDEYLLRPDLGRRLNEEARQLIVERCVARGDMVSQSGPSGVDAGSGFPPRSGKAGGPDLQIVIGDGLSVTGVRTQVPALLPLIARQAAERGWTVGQPFAVRYCRVGVMNAVGELLRPRVIALLIGERPGQSTAESLSAYMAFQPASGHNDAQRNLISNIHARGVPVPAAATRIVELAARMMLRRISGVLLKEEMPSAHELNQ